MSRNADCLGEVINFRSDGAVLVEFNILGTKRRATLAPSELEL